jgi:hypothetical protein
MKRLSLVLFALILFGVPVTGQEIAGDSYNGAYYFPAPDPSKDSAGFSSALLAAASGEANDPAGESANARRNKSVTGNFFFAPGVVADENDTAGLVHFGGGVEGPIKGSNFGLSLDGGFFSGADMESISISPGIIYQFTSRGNTVPFLKGGYTLLWAGEGSGSMIHLGGGVNQWLSDRFGVRFEARDTIWIESPDFQIFEFRAAVVIR